MKTVKNNHKKTSQYYTFFKEKSYTFLNQWSTIIQVYWARKKEILEDMNINWLQK